MSSPFNIVTKAHAKKSDLFKTHQIMAEAKQETKNSLIRTQRAGVTSSLMGQML